MSALKPIKYFLSVALLFFIIPLKGYSQINFNSYDDNLSIGRYTQYYIDSTSKQTLNTIITNNHSFQTTDSDVPNFGLIDYPLWLKIVIRNKSHDPDLLLQFDQALMDTIDFYYPKNGKFKVNSSGIKHPFQSRQVEYHKFIYELHIPFDSTVTYYARIKTSQKMQLPIYLGEKDKATISNLYKSILFGVFLGIIFVMFFYNLFIYFTVKDSIYLYYVIYILIAGLLQATIEGYSAQFLWPDNEFLSARMFFIFTALVNMSSLEFVRRFLNIKNFYPGVTKVFFALYAIYLVSLIITLLGNLHLTYQILQVIAGVVPLFMLAISIIIAKRGYRPAKFFIVAWIPLIAGIVIFVLRDFSIVPYNVFTNNSITIGSALEVILLSFALADRINIFKAEKEESQLETVKALQENERIIREQNVVLELKVNERTSALNQSNQELNTTLEDLKQTQTQLVESEKMASLGQLTAGIAHEINNPINFVTSNITPLKRDVDMLLDALVMIENVGMSDSSAADKQKQIDEYKEELDFDYLKIEINHLLKGIHEGASRTAEIVKGLRIFSRMDEDDLKKADINEGIESTLIIINNLLNNRIKIICEYGNLQVIECYPGKLNQVFLNILSNAIHAINAKYGENAGGIIKIHTSCDEDKVYVKIEDNGTGMDANTQKKIFEPFFTTKEVGEGTGLGMSIVYNTIKKHNGQIFLKSVIGEGSEFILELPVIHQIEVT